MAGASSLSGTTSKDFGTLGVGVTSASFSWTIQNAAGAPSTGSLALSNNDATEVSVTNGCPATLAGGASCTIAVTFRPSSVGARNGALTMSASPGGTVMLSLSAMGNVQLTVTTVGTGTVTSVPAGITCPGTCTATFSTSPVMLQARTANGSNSLFTGWNDPLCPGVARDCSKYLTTANVTATATFAVLSANLIFGTAATFPTDLGGTAPYDAACNTAATAAGLNTTAGNGYVALLSDQNSNAITRVSSARGWVRMDGRPFTDTASGTFSKVSSQVIYPFAFFENGLPTNGAVFATATGLTGPAPAAPCSNWTSTIADGLLVSAGLGEGGPWSWFQGTGITCGELVHLICMGISKNVAVTAPPPAPAGRKIWLSGDQFTPGSATTPDAVCQAALPSGVSAAAALIATTTKTAASLLVPATSYYRPDGALVGSGGDLISAGQGSNNPILLSGVWQAGDGTYPMDESAWTGSPSISVVGTVASTCGNWADSSQTGVYGFGGMLAGTFWDFTPITCATSFRLYCVQTAP